MKIALSATIFSALFATGCASFGSLNLQRSGLRGLGDTAVTVLLDQLPESQWEAASTELADAFQRLTDFVETGETQNLVFPKLVEKVRSVIPTQYRSIGEALLVSIEHGSATVDVDVEIVGQDNLDRIKAFLEGAGSGLRAYRKDHRPPPEPQPEVPVDIQPSDV